MLLDSNYKNEDKIRRKAYNVDTPVCNAGLRIHSIHRHSYPELRFACTRLSESKTYGLVVEKQSYKICSFEHDFNLLK